MEGKSSAQIVRFLRLHANSQDSPDSVIGNCLSTNYSKFAVEKKEIVEFFQNVRKFVFVKKIDGFLWKKLEFFQNCQRLQICCRMRYLMKTFSFHLN